MNALEEETTDQRMERCEHRKLRYPGIIPAQPGAIISCPDCGASWQRPRWMDAFYPGELRSIQGIFELLAVYLDYVDPHPTEKISKRELNKRWISLMHMHEFEGKERSIGDLLRRLGEVTR